MKVLIVEDSIGEAVDLRMKLDEIGGIDHEHVVLYEQAVSCLDNDHFDLIIIDILLDHQPDGFKLAELVQGMNIPFFIATNYNVEDNFDELKRLKPFALFQKPIDKIALRFRLDQLKSNLDHQGRTIETFFIRNGQEYLQLPLSQILFFQGEGNYVTIHMEDKKHVIRHSIKRIVERLPQSFFIQVHRNFVVALDRIVQFNGVENTVRLKETTVPVGRTYRRLLVKKLRLG